MEVDCFFGVDESGVEYGGEDRAEGEGPGDEGVDAARKNADDRRRRRGCGPDLARGIATSGLLANGLRVVGVWGVVEGPSASLNIASDARVFTKSEEDLFLPVGDC